uniref:Protein MEMO1 n=1 Tax=Amphora coffeiformis TaxID=265554 RepID=A0A7S3L8W0_9STRA
MGSVAGKAAMSYVPYPRRAHHAGSWYSNETAVLSDELQHNLDHVVDTASAATSRGVLRGVICPHAGYSYSGPTAAYSYKALQAELVRRHNNNNTNKNEPTTTIVVLHPSHHVYLENCALSGATALHTPVGDLPVDDALRQEIWQLDRKLFSVMTQSDDEHEHSGEMQYPYLAKIIPTGMQVQVLPIMCGNLSHAKEALVGQTLSNILQRPNVLTVVSTDFCHWGRRFSYQPTDGNIPIHQFIRQMDHRGMDLIAHDWQRPGAFADYLRDTRNTICGRHAIAVWLHALSTAYPPATTTVPTIAFVKYAQSSAAKSMHDSSVSYAAAVCTLESPSSTSS